jgi:hypothetical protein
MTARVTACVASVRSDVVVGGRGERLARPALLRGAPLRAHRQRVPHRMPGFGLRQLRPGTVPPPPNSFLATRIAIRLCSFCLRLIRPRSCG